MMIRFGQGNEATKRKATEEGTSTSRKSQRRNEAAQLTDGTSAFMQTLPHDQFNRQQVTRKQIATADSKFTVTSIEDFLKSYTPRLTRSESHPKDPLATAESTFNQLDSKDKPLKGDAANAMIARHIIATKLASNET